MKKIVYFAAGVLFFLSGCENKTTHDVSLSDNSGLVLFNPLRFYESFSFDYSWVFLVGEEYRGIASLFENQNKSFSLSRNEKNKTNKKESPKKRQV